ncbi:MAG: hypothetical protein M3P18_26895 [Actinomycetota bacterium]|nr:hypothetical protein [Actinomycetota bacterium]
MVVLVGLLGLFGGFLRAQQAPASYQAESVVAAVKLSPTALTSSSGFGSLAQVIFNTDTVINPVIQQLGLHTTRGALLGQKRLQMLPVTNATAIRIVAIDNSPSGALALARAAATSFQSVLSAQGLGKFTAFQPSARPESSTPGAAIGGALGGAAGVLLAVVVMMVVAIVRQPIRGITDAVDEISPHYTFPAAVRPRSLRLRNREQTADIHPAGLVDALSRTAGVLGGAITCCVVARGSGGSDRARLALQAQISQSSIRKNSLQAVGSEILWLEPHDDRVMDSLEKSHLLITVVVDGASRQQLRELAEQDRLAPGERQRLLVYMIRGSRLPHRAWESYRFSSEREDAPAILRFQAKQEEAAR